MLEFIGGIILGVGLAAGLLLAGYWLGWRSRNAIGVAQGEPPVEATDSIDYSKDPTILDGPDVKVEKE